MVTSRVVTSAGIAFLFVAGLFKLYAGIFIPNLELKVGYSREFAIAFGIAECMFAISLLRTSTAWAHLSLSGIYFVFSAVAIWKTISGVEICGCFGVFAVPPAVTAAFDVLLTIALYSSCPNRTFVYSWKMFSTLHLNELFGQAFGWILGVGVVAALLVIMDPNAIRLRRAPLTGVVEDSVAVDHGQSKEILVKIPNREKHDIWLQGSATSCSCVTGLSGPVNVPALSSVSVPITITPKREGRFSESIKFFTTESGQFSFIVKVNGLSKSHE